MPRPSRPRGNTSSSPSTEPSRGLSKALRIGLCFLFLALFVLLLPGGVGAGAVTPPTPPVSLSAAPGSKIAFVSNRDDNEEIYTINPDGSGLARWTQHLAVDRFPAWSPEGQLAFASTRSGNYDIYILKDYAAEPLSLTNHPKDDYHPAWAPDGTRIAFTSFREGNAEIYAVNADGSVLARLTSHPAQDQFPTWSPSGQRIAFVSDREGNDDIYVMDADGANPVNLTHYPAGDFHPAWSPDGNKIAFASDRDGNYEIYVMNADGSNLVKLTSNSAADFYPTWSPEGTKIAFTTNRDDNYEIYVMNADGSGQTNVTMNPALDLLPAWGQVPAPLEVAPAQLNIFLFSGGLTAATVKVTNNKAQAMDWWAEEDPEVPWLTLQPQGGNLSPGDSAEVTVSLSAPGLSPGSYSAAIVVGIANPVETVAQVAINLTVLPPPGGKIVFDCFFVETGDDVCVMNADGSGQVNLSQMPSRERYPHWSPDGSKIAFTSNRDGNDEVYIMNADGSNQVNLTQHSAWDDLPAWSPDGSKIAFTSNREGNAEVYVMNADGSNPVNLTNNLAADGFPAWSPDGSQIAFASNRDGNYEVYLVDADGSNQVNVSRYPANDGDPAWSPDGTRIAFTSERDGNREVYLMAPDGSNQVNMSQHPAWDFNPAWSPDGSRIAFVRFPYPSGNFEIFVMDADGSDLIKLPATTSPWATLDWWQQVLPIKAETSLTVGIDQDGVAGVGVALARLFDPASGETVSALLQSYSATLSYPGTGINVLEVRPNSAFADSGADIDNSYGYARFFATAINGVAAPLSLAFPAIRLVGSVQQSYDLSLNFLMLTDADTRGLIPQEKALSLPLRRGDARADGVVNIADVLFIAQYLAGLRGLGAGPNQVHPINAASIKHDQGGDGISVADVLYLAQYLAGLRNPYLEAVPLRR